MPVTDEGIETLESDEHPSKAEHAMYVTDEGIEIIILKKFYYNLFIY